MMIFTRLAPGRSTIVRGILGALLSLSASHAMPAADQFPFEQELLLDVEPMPPAKRVPILTVTQDGNAIIDLWCRTVPARVAVSDDAIKVEPGPLPEGLPEMMSNGQCSAPRMQADEDLLAALAQITSWRWDGPALVFLGPKVLKFRPSDH